MSLPAGRGASGQVLSASLATGAGERLLDPSIVCRSDIVFSALAHGGGADAGQAACRQPRTVLPRRAPACSMGGQEGAGFF